MMKTADPELMRAINTFHILDTIRQNEPISRVEIADRTELSRATVSAITAALLDEQLIGTRHVAGPGSSGRGRPRVMLMLNPAAAHVAGVKLSAHQINVAVTNFRADVLATVNLPIRTARQPMAVIADIVEDGVRQCVSDAGLRMDALSGLGIGLPGFVDSRTGLSHWSPIFGHAPTPLAGLIEDRVQTRVAVDTDANLVAMAEHWFGEARGLDSFAVVTVDDTIGLGLFVGGAPHHGAHGMGGQLGHLCLDPDGPPCRCGQRGCVDAYASSHALAKAMAAGDGGAGHSIAPVQILTTLEARAQGGDAKAETILDRAAQALGQALASLITLTAPPKLILTGSVLRVGSPFSVAIQTTVARRVPAALAPATEILFRPWDEEAWARGAASLVLRELYGSPWQAGRQDFATAADRRSAVCE